MGRMPQATFVMSGSASPLRLAEPCPVARGPHNANLDDGAYLVADVAVRDGTAKVRLALWRCARCGVMLVGVGPLCGTMNGGADRAEVDAQEFTWLEETVAAVGAERKEAQL